MSQWTGRRIIIMITLCLLSLLPVQAQQNLLQNPGFEDDYSGRMGRGDFTFPAGWEGWFTESPRTDYWMNVPPTGYPHNGPFRRSGDSALSIAKGSGTFTAATLQRVPNIPVGAIVRGTAYVYLENNEGTNAQVRIGIGSNVGTNVNGAITWSDWEKRLNGLHQISVEHVATGGEVTLIIYANQTWPNDPNALYIDDAELLIVGAGEAPAESGGDNNVVAVESRPSGVPFVSPQKSQAGEDVTHVVGSGDTLASIAVAYSVPIDEIAALNGLDKSKFLQIGQVLLIATPDLNQPSQPEEQSVAENAEVEEAPVATEEIVEVIVTPTAIPTESPPPSTQEDTIFSVSLITQHSSSVNMNQTVGNTFTMTFSDNHFRVVQVMPEFNGDNLPLELWTEAWSNNPNSVIQDVMLVVDEFTFKLSLSGLQFDGTDNSISYSATIEGVTNAQGQTVDISTIPSDVLLNNPDVYFQLDDTIFDVLSMTSQSTSIELGEGFLCSWLGC